MKTHLVNSRGLRGNVLVLTIVVTGLIGFVLAAYLSLVKTQNVATARSQSWNAAIPMIEAGIEDALTHLNVHGPTNLACDGWSQAGDLYFISRSLGDGYYVTIISNWLAGTNCRPVVDSRAFVSVPAFANREPDWMLAAAGASGVSQGYLTRGVRVVTRSQGLFTKAMVAKGTIRFNGGVHTDSFNSEDPNLSTGGKYDPAKTRDNGDVASNQQIVNAVSSVGNVKIYGHVATGPHGTVGFSGNAAAGSKAWVDAGNTGVQTGWFKDDMNVNFPDVPVPFAGGFALSSGSVNGTNYAMLLGSDNYRACSVSMKNKEVMMVTGNAKLYVDGSFSMGSQNSIIIAPGATLQLYVNGNIDLTGQGVFNESGKAMNCFVYGRPNCTSIKLAGNADFCGVIYAPNAAFTLQGGGSSDTDFVGACITGSVDMGGSYNFHYDETLANAGPAKGFAVISWDEMTPTHASVLPASIATMIGTGN